MDYAGNSKKDRETDTPEKPEKKVEKAVVAPVVVKKRSLGRKFKDLFVEADLKGVARYVFSDVLIPAARNMIVDGAESGIRRMFYGERAHRYMQGTGTRITYNSPVSRGSISMAPMRSRGYPAEPRRREPRPRDDSFLISTREEAELVLERMNDVLDKYEVVSVAELHELLGHPVQAVDHKWGWVFLGDVPIRQTSDGYLLEFPPAEPIH